MTTVIDYTTLKETNSHLHYILCYLVALLWEGVDILEDEDFDETRLVMNPSMQIINKKSDYLWKLLSCTYPEQEIIITYNNHSSTFNTNNRFLTLCGVPFEKIDVNDPLEGLCL
jgi:hypothetical protein